MRVIEKTNVTSIEPIFCSVAAGAVILGRSKRFILDAIARGKIKAVKSDSRTLLLVQSLKDYAAKLPAAKGTINPPKRIAVGPST